MEVTTQQHKDIELITITGRVDSVEAPQFVQALEAANRRGRYRIVIDMNRLEYMSSAGFRALNNAQRKSKRQPEGEVVLARVPPLVQEALELVGFAQYFASFNDVESALEYMETSENSSSAAGAQPVPAE